MLVIEKEKIVKSAGIELPDYYYFFKLGFTPCDARLNSHYEAWSYKKRSTKRVTGYRKSV